MNIYPNKAIIMAPLAGYTDLPYRRSCRRHGCIYAFTEMIDTGALIYANRNTRRFLDKGADEVWLGVQIVGCKLDEISKSIDIINTYDFNILDLNVGCPTAKVVKRGKGAGLAKDFELLARIIDVMVKKSRSPVSAKIRIQDTIDMEKTVMLAKRIEEAGVQALTVHGRTLNAIYSGPCYANIISAIRENVKIQVIANGGVMDIASYHNLQKNSGCSEIMIARGAMGNPWIFEEIINGKIITPSIDELANELELHIRETIAYYGENFGCKFCRKLILDYISGRGLPKELKLQTVKISTLKDFETFMERLRELKSTET